MNLQDDDGLSLIELIIVVLLIGVLGVVIGMIFINSVKAQDTVTTTTEAITGKYAVVRKKPIPGTGLCTSMASSRGTTVSSGTHAITYTKVVTRALASIGSWASRA